MAKVCRSCGKEYKGEYCEHCGYGDPNLKTKAAEKYKKNTTPVRFMTPEQRAEYYAQQKKDYRERVEGKKKRDPKQVRLLIAVSVGVLALIFGTLFGSGVLGFNEKADDIVHKYLTAINERDFDAYASCFPKEMKKDIEQDLAATEFSEEEYMEEFNSVFAEEYGNDFKIEYNILRDETLESFSLDVYRESYGVTPNVSEACLVITDVTFNGSAGKETYRMDFYLGKVGRHWKVFNLQYEAGIVTPDMEIGSDSIAEQEEA